MRVGLGGSQEREKIQALTPNPTSPEVSEPYQRMLLAQLPTREKQ